MRKNKMMRFASGLLVATLLTTCIISGTFAKYVTSGEGTDKARVAKFGVTVTAHGDTFAKTYAKTDKSFTAETNTVVSANDNKVVAPGTSGKMTSMQLTGTPEVAVKVTYTGNFALNGKWNVGEEFYCPLIINVNNIAIKGTNYKSEAEFVNAVNAEINKYSNAYEAGTDLSSKTSDSLNVSWEWPYTGNDTNDTQLGNAAEAGEVTLDVTTTVTQID